uniref:hypothetical protein n=1 Tax=Inonotus hispidus TaxID=40469 RepID=UPI002181FA87|nr:hypothetical protein N4M07_mgp042 [Inonotus hispidus]UVF38010.1 hypothetical protein [Inonotus hispidus]
MKLRQILFIFLILIVSSMLIFFIYNMLTDPVSDNLANLSTHNTNVAINNQISARDLKNVTSTLTSDNSTCVFNDGTSPTTVTLILAVSFSVAAVVALTFLGVTDYCTSGVISSPENAIELNNLRG